MKIYCKIKIDGSGSLNNRSYANVVNEWKKNDIPISCGYFDEEMMNYDSIFSEERRVGKANFLYETEDGRLCYNVIINDNTLSSKIKKIALNEEVKLGPFGTGSFARDNITITEFNLIGFDLLYHTNERLLLRSNTLITEHMNE